MSEPDFRPNLADVRQELTDQIEKWGIQCHELPVYLTVLIEEVGEVARAILDARSRPNALGADTKIHNELVQVAAVAIAMAEALDSGRSLPGKWVSGKQDD